MNSIFRKLPPARQGLILVTWILTLGLSAQVGADAVEPVVTAVDGQPYTVSWPDGREAALKITMAQSKPLRVPFKVSENNCTNRQGQTCTYNLIFRRYWADLVWTKNPDANAIGKTVNQIFKDPNGQVTSSNPLQVDGLVATGMDPAHLSGLMRGLPPNEIECGDYTWLPGMPSKVPERISILRWDGEDNQPNPETGLNENRTIGGMTGVELTHNSGQRMQISSVTGKTGSLNLSDIIMANSSQSLTFTKPDGFVCQTAISNSGVGDLIAEYDKLTGQHPSNLADVPTYIWGSDALMKSPLAEQGMMFWFRSSSVDYL